MVTHERKQGPAGGSARGSLLSQHGCCWLSLHTHTVTQSQTSCLHANGVELYTHPLTVENKKKKTCCFKSPTYEHWIRNQPCRRKRDRCLSLFYTRRWKTRNCRPLQKPRADYCRVKLATELQNLRQGCVHGVAQSYDESMLMTGGINSEMVGCYVVCAYVCRSHKTMGEETKRKKKRLRPWRAPSTQPPPLPFALPPVSSKSSSSCFSPPPPLLWKKRQWKEGRGKWLTKFCKKYIKKEKRKASSLPVLIEVASIFSSYY